jgi:hypothetical protein
MDRPVGSFVDLRLNKGGAIVEQMIMRKPVCLRQLGDSRGGV